MRVTKSVIDFQQPFIILQNREKAVSDKAYNYIKWTLLVEIGTKDYLVKMPPIQGSTAALKLAGKPLTSTSSKQMRPLPTT